jgi:transposase InsO family protein
MEASFCIAALEDALVRHGKPDIFNTDQGSQFTGAAFTGVLADRCSTCDGKDDPNIPWFDRCPHPLPH